MTPSEDDCPLCHIASGRLRTRVVVATDRAVAFMNDLEPMAPGHVVVFPRRHGLRLDAIPDDDLAAVMATIKRIAAALQLENYNVLQNNGALAGQTVWHAHFHLIPKWSEAVGLRYEREHPSGVEHGDIYERLRAALARG